MFNKQIAPKFAVVASLNLVSVYLMSQRCNSLSESDADIKKKRIITLP
jgi:hypothetical protein